MPQGIRKWLETPTPRKGSTHNPIEISSDEDEPEHALPVERQKPTKSESRSKPPPVQSREFLDLTGEDGDLPASLKPPIDSNLGHPSGFQSSSRKAKRRTVSPIDDELPSDDDSHQFWDTTTPVQKQSKTRAGSTPVKLRRPPTRLDGRTSTTSDLMLTPKVGPPRGKKKTAPEASGLPSTSRGPSLNFFESVTPGPSLLTTSSPKIDPLKGKRKLRTQTKPVPQSVSRRPSALSNKDDPAREETPAPLNISRTASPKGVYSSDTESDVRPLRSPAKRRKLQPESSIESSFQDGHGSSTSPPTPAPVILSVAVSDKEDSDEELLPSPRKKRIPVVLSESSEDEDSPTPPPVVRKLRRRQPSESSKGSSIRGPDSLGLFSEGIQVTNQPRRQRDSSVSSDATTSDAMEEDNDAEEGSQAGNTTQTDDESIESFVVSDDVVEYEDDASTEVSRDSSPTSGNDQEQEDETIEEDDESSVDAIQDGHSETADSGSASAAEDRLPPVEFDLNGKREPQLQFELYVRYLLHWSRDREVLVNLEKTTDKRMFQSAIAWMNNQLESGTMQYSQWKAPFLTTLKLRPTITFNYSGVALDGFQCSACWQRGKYNCYSSSGESWEITFGQAGTYDHDTLVDEDEDSDIEYVVQTHWPNNALAPSTPHPPEHRVIVGHNCALRAHTFHKLFHYKYHLLKWVEEQLEAADNMYADDVLEGLLEHSRGKSKLELKYLEFDDLLHAPGGKQWYAGGYPSED